MFQHGRRRPDPGAPVVHPVFRFVAVVGRRCTFTSEIHVAAIQLSITLGIRPRTEPAQSALGASKDVIWVDETEVSVPTVVMLACHLATKKTVPYDLYRKAAQLLMPDFFHVLSFHALRETLPAKTSSMFATTCAMRIRIAKAPASATLNPNPWPPSM